MLKEVILFIKYPYTAGIIAIIWLGTAIIMAIEQDLPFMRMVIVNMIVTIFVAAIGFSGKKEI